MGGGRGTLLGDWLGISQLVGSITCLSWGILFFFIVFSLS